ncbi:SIR2 family protein [Bacteroides sp. OttesenSCG-928-D19]|nr:SIR2 family protein [Bacteroides sp. OttesenSCG-928-N06]MDL2304278.1 SIR2 family protein [Bacteroides sp. OttesenSCG-928-D19]
MGKFKRNSAKNKKRKVIGKLENKKDNIMSTITHDLIRHLKALRQTLAQDKKPIGFFISAGCPLSVEMDDKTKWPLIPDMKRLSEYVSSKLKSTNPGSPSCFDRLIVELKSANKDENNLEDILSFIRSLKDVAHGGGTVRGLKEQELIDLETSICKHIVEKIRVDLPNKSTPYHKFARWISSIDRDKSIEIFTTNYDLLMEQALEDTSIPYFDGFVGSRQPFFDLRSVEDNLIPKHWSRLWKIHGSINWYQKTNKEVFRSDAFKNDGKDASFLIYPSHLKYDQSRKMPFLALSDQLSRFLKQPSAALILCGYSFNDDHINDTIVNALKSNPTAIVIALMFGNMKTDDKENYPKGVEIAQKRHNISFWTNNEAIIGTNQGKWSTMPKDVDDALNHFIIKDTTSTDIHTKIGDFKVFSEFLSSLIGHIGEEEKDGK